MLVYRSISNEYLDFPPATRQPKAEWGQFALSPSIDAARCGECRHAVGAGMAYRLEVHMAEALYQVSLGQMHDAYYRARGRLTAQEIEAALPAFLALMSGTGGISLVIHPHHEPVSYGYAGTTEGEDA